MPCACSFVKTSSRRIWKDLYNVAEIRRPRGGGMEIKFFDRIKALQCLERMETEAGQPSLFEALEAGARALNKGEPDET